MKKLQKREKVLLIVLLVILVAVVPFVLLIFPVMQQNTGKADTLAVLEASRMEMETRLAAKPALETALAEIEERYAENEELIPPAMKNYDIHYLVSDICSKAGVTLDSLSIGEYEAAGGGTDGSQQPEQEQSAFLSRVVLQLQGAEGGRPWASRAAPGRRGGPGWAAAVLRCGIRRAHAGRRLADRSRG